MEAVLNAFIGVFAMLIFLAIPALVATVAALVLTALSAHRARVATHRGGKPDRPSLAADVTATRP